MKRLLAVLLCLATLIPLGVTVPGSAAKYEKSPFYMVNWMGGIHEELPDNIDDMPKFLLEDIKVGDTKITITYENTSDIPTIAKLLKKEFDSRPKGMRHINFPMSVEANVEHMIYMDKTVALFKAWIKEFFTEYKKIGGKVDGLVLDTEYSPIGAYYIHKAYRTTSTIYDEGEGTYVTIPRNLTIYNDIVSDPRYATDVRPYLEERGFPFSTPNGYEDEIYPISATDGDYTAYNIWDAVMRNRYCKYINEACSAFMELYPNADVSNYRFSGGKQWEMATSQSGGQLNTGGNTMYAGNNANENMYLRRPYSGMRDTSSKYVTPITYNETVYEDNPFNAFLMETNIFKDMYASSDNKRISATIAGFNYQISTTRPKNGVFYTPYYAETLFHIGLLDPKPFIGYIIGPRDTDEYDDPYDYSDVMRNISDILKELTRVVGYADRKPIFIPRTWNSNFVLSGMYAAGRNVWRITPNTCEGTTLESFKVKDQAPTFTIDGETVIFPQGRIIEDKNVYVTGTCGYWIETPADVMPVIINDTDRYEKYPAYEENFETYDVGTTFSKSTVRHPDGWIIGAKGFTVQSHNGSKALEMSGTAVIENTKIPMNVTAGDSYAKQQVWEVTVTVPGSGELQVLTCDEDDSGILIAGGKVYYNESTELASVTAGQTYIISREVDFRNASAFTSTYTVRNADGTVVAQKAGVAMKQVSLPVKNIGFSCDSVDKAYIDNYRLRAIGVTTELSLFEADTGMRIEDTTAATTENAVYRVSWLNATGEYQVAKVYNNGKLIQTIEMPSGADSFTTGQVKSNSKITVTVEKGTAPTIPNYDTGDFNWVAGQVAAPEPTEKPTNPSNFFEQGDLYPTDDFTYPHETGDNSYVTEDTFPDETEPVTTEKGLSGGAVAAIAGGSTLAVSGGGFALCYYVIKPKWLYAFLKAIKSWISK